jgi:hypothetical protein
MPETVWTPEAIKQGIDRYIAENDHPPTAHDFDQCPFLPSARQMQRAYGGLEKLRLLLGYDELNYTKGALRRARSITGHTEGTAAEDLLEARLINKFGEAFVHTQKRYYVDHKNRYDFFVYYHGGHFAVDIFTTSRPNYIGTNIRHKIPKYKNVPSTTPIFFVVSGRSITSLEVEKRTASISGLKSMPNVRVILLKDFERYIETLVPLKAPTGLKLLLEDIEQI